MTVPIETEPIDQDQINYFRSRWEYTRPNLITLADNAGRYFEDLDGNRVWLPTGDEGHNYIFLSDHNRSSANFAIERIGDRRRMINATMRSYWIADKITLPLTWENIPSRSYSDLRGFSWWVDHKSRCAKFTVDGGAGGAEMLDWWQQHIGSMWAFINIDNNTLTQIPESEGLNGYSKVYEVMITDFSYDIKDRSHGYRVDDPELGPTMFSLDLWDVSMTLEEV